MRSQIFKRQKLIFLYVKSNPSQNQFFQIILLPRFPKPILFNLSLLTIRSFAFSLFNSLENFDQGKTVKVILLGT